MFGVLVIEKVSGGLTVTSNELAKYLQIALLYAAMPILTTIYVAVRLHAKGKRL